MQNEIDIENDKEKFKIIELEQKNPKFQTSNISMIKSLQQKAIEAIGIEMYDKIYYLVQQNLNNDKKEVK